MLQADSDPGDTEGIQQEPVQPLTQAQAVQLLVQVARQGANGDTFITYVFCT